MADVLIRRPTIWLPMWAMLQAFPLALFTGALISDIAYVNTAQIQWSNFSSWMIAGGLLMGGFAIAAAIVCALVNRRAISWKRAAIFGIGSILTWGVALLNAFVHAQDAWASVMPMGLVLSAVVVILVVVTSWIGFADASNRVERL